MEAICAPRQSQKIQCFLGGTSSKCQVIATWGEMFRALSATRRRGQVLTSMSLDESMLQILIPVLVEFGFDSKCNMCFGWFMVDAYGKEDRVRGILPGGLFAGPLAALRVAAELCHLPVSCSLWGFVLPESAAKRLAPCLPQSEVSGTIFSEPDANLTFS